MKKLLAFALAGALAVGAVGCGSQSQQSSSESASASTEAAESSSSESTTGEDESIQVTEIDESLYDLEYTNRELDPSYDESSATKIDLAAGTVDPITSEGVYVLSGAYEGQVLVNAPEDAKVQLVLDGVDVTNPKGAAIYVQQADKCFITLAEGSQNSVADGEEYAFDDSSDEPDAAIFSTCDLVLQGSGSLTVASVYNDAVKTKDDLVVTGGTYGIAAVGDGLVGKDSVKIADGTVTVKTTEGDGIKSSKDDDENKGFVSIDGGDIQVDAGDKGVKAETYLRVTGGTVDVTSADDALHCDGCGRVAGGDLTISAGDDGIHVEYVLEMNGGMVDITKSYEGLEGQTIEMNGGDVSIVASDDGINAATAGSGSDEFGAVMGGDGTSHRMGGFGRGWNGDAGDGSSSSSADGSANGAAQGNAPQMPNGAQQMPDGEAPEPPDGEMPQMPEGEAPEMPEGEAPGGAMRGGQTPPDMQGSGSTSGSTADGVQGAGQGGRMGGQGGGFGGGGGMMDADENCTLTINGGTLVVDAGGDGLDSNGAIVLNGGTVYVNGPTSNGDGALDCGTTITSNGGTLIAVGSSGMAESFTDGTQPFAQASFNGQAGVELQVRNDAGEVLAAFTPTKAYQNVVVTVPEFAEGSTYTLAAGDATAEITASTTATESAGFGGMGGFGGGMGQDGQGGGRPDGVKGGRGGGQMPGGAS